MTLRTSRIHRVDINTVDNRDGAVRAIPRRTRAGSHSPAPMSTITRLTVDPRNKDSMLWKGHWLAHSIDLHCELQSLMPQAQQHIGPINQVMFLVAEWGAEARSEVINRESVRMLGLRYSSREHLPHDTITLSGRQRTMQISIRRPPSPIGRKRSLTG